MFDIGWLEMVVIGTVALVVVGPKDLPVLFRSAGQFMAKMRAMAREFQRTMEQAAKESGLTEATKGLDSFTNIGLGSATASAQNFARNVMAGKTEAAQGGPEPAKAAPASAKPAAVPEKAAVQRKGVTRKKPEAKPEAAPESKPKPKAAKPARGSGDTA